MLRLSSTSEKSLFSFHWRVVVVFFFLSNKTIFFRNHESLRIIFVTIPIVKTKVNLCTTKNTTSRKFFFKGGEKNFSSYFKQIFDDFFHKNLNLKLFLLKKMSSEINIWFARKRKQKFVCKYRKEIEDDTTEYFRA